MAWYSIISSMCLLSDKVVAGIKKSGPATVPHACNAVVDHAIAGILLWHGWIITGSLYYVHFLIIAIRIYGKGETKSDEPAAATEPVVQ